MACVWLSDDSEVRVLPDACADIVFESGRLIVAGPASTQVIVPETPGHARFGVRFRVGSAGAGLGVPASELLDEAVALSALWGTAGRRLEALVAAASSPEQGLRTLIDGVGDRQQQGREADVVVREAAFLLAGGASSGPSAMDRERSFGCNASSASSPCSIVTRPPAWPSWRATPATPTRPTSAGSVAACPASRPRLC